MTSVKIIQNDVNNEMYKFHEYSYALCDPISSVTCAAAAQQWGLIRLPGTQTIDCGYYN